MKPLIRTVRKNKGTGQKIITVPQECTEIQAGDIIRVIKVEESAD